MKRVLSALLCFCCSSLLLAATLPALAPSLSQEQINLLEKGELLTTSSYEGDIWSLIPDGSRIATSIKDALENKKGFTLAISTLVPYPEGWKSLSGEERMLEMVNKAFETTTMDGMLFHPSPD
ncbi:MAG: hypothetical protein KBS81_05705, partial [Spirochaetales bacterium]|nr:hypothetical protein [Candidatus Physcosoma equi]